MRSSLYGGLILVAILSLVAAGCGSSNNDSTSTTAALSKSQFLKKGNAICKKGNQKINQAAKQVFAPHKKPSKAEETTFATDTLIPTVQSEINGVNALGAPKGDEAKVNQIVNSAQAALDKGKKDPTLFFSNKTDPFKESNKITTAYGLTVCGGGGNS